jgi:hypothetical protein
LVKLEKESLPNIPIYIKPHVAEWVPKKYTMERTEKYEISRPSKVWMPRPKTTNNIRKSALADNRPHN